MLHKKKILEICRESSLNIQLSADQHMCIKKLPRRKNHSEGLERTGYDIHTRQGPVTVSVSQIGKLRNSLDIR